MSATVKKKSVKYCIVPECTNSSINSPEKLFISLPSDQKLRRAWQQAMRRSGFLSDKGTRFCCEDHFNVEEDIQNYFYIKTMKCGRIQLQPGVIPHIFDCQKKRSALQTFKPRLSIQKKERKAIVEELLREHLTNEEFSVTDKGVEIKPQECNLNDQGVQVNLMPKRRSKSVQCLSSQLDQKTCKTPKSENVNKDANKKKKKKM